MVDFIFAVITINIIVCMSRDDGQYWRRHAISREITNSRRKKKNNKILTRLMVIKLNMAKRLRVRMILHISPVICKFTRKTREAKHNVNRGKQNRVFEIRNSTSKRLHPLGRFDHAPDASFPFVDTLGTLSRRLPNTALPGRRLLAR